MPLIVLVAGRGALKSSMMRCEATEYAASSPDPAIEVFRIPATNLPIFVVLSVVDFVTAEEGDYGQGGSAMVRGN